jgi:hypothetical protein
MIPFTDDDGEDMATCDETGDVSEAHPTMGCKEVHPNPRSLPEGFHDQIISPTSRRLSDIMASKQNTPAFRLPEIVNSPV